MTEPQMTIPKPKTYQDRVVDRSMKIDSAYWDDLEQSHVIATVFGRTGRLALSDDLVVKFLADGGEIAPFVPNEMRQP
jgi:hypothetical protein